MRNRNETSQLKGGTGPLKAHRRRRRRIRWRRLMLSLSVLCGLGGAAIYGAVYSLLNSYRVSAGNAGGAGDWARGLTPLREHRNILVMGTDYSYSEGQRDGGLPVRSDSLLVVALSPTRHKATILSIPRDTGVYINGRFDKVNAALSLGGPPLASRVISSLLGVPIDRWVTVNTAGLENVVDVLGGIPITVDRDMRYHDHTAKLDIDIPRGFHILNGKQAHQYVRFRHDGLGDIGRVQRQQKFLQAFTDVLLSPGTFFKLPQLFSTSQKYLATDMSGSELIQATTHCMKLERSQIHLLMMPGQFSQGGFSASYWLVSSQVARALGQRFFTVEGSGEHNWRRETTKLTLLNGSHHPRLATLAAKKLGAMGWNIHSLGDAPSRLSGATQVIVQTGRVECLAALQRDLNVNSNCIHASVGDLTTDFTIILNDEYARTIDQASGQSR